MMIDEAGDKIVKITAGIMAAIVVLALVLVSFTVIEWKSFWIIIIIAAFVAYLVIPFMRERLEVKHGQ